MRNILSAIILVAFAAPAALAQSTAIRFILGEGHKVYTKPAFGNYCMGVGVDRTFNDRLTAGFDLGFDVAGALRVEPKSVQVGSANMESDYALSPKLLSVNYHTEYALGANDGTHAYIGTFVGLRHISQQWTSSGYFEDNMYVEQHVNISVSKWLVPIGLRMGLRGTTEGGFMDLYLAAGYQVGGGKSLVALGGMKDTPYTETSALAFTLGWAYGFGW